MIAREGPAWKIFERLKKGAMSHLHSGNGHDFEHIERMLAMRQTFWSEIIRDEPHLVSDPFLPDRLDLAISFHDLNRSAMLSGKTATADARRADFALTLMRQYGIGDATAHHVIDTIQVSYKQDAPSETDLLRLLRDFDKADMGAVGIYRMAAVADSRNYGVFARTSDFDPHASAIEGDENLDSFCADIKYCLEWWTNPKFIIRTRAIRNRVKRRFDYMVSFLERIRSEYQEIGLI